METTRNERFLQFFEWTGLTSNGLAVKLGMNSRTIYNYTNKGINPTDTCVRQIGKVFPQINTTWMYDGVGEMITDKEISDKTPLLVSPPDPVRQVEKSSKVNELYERIISTLEQRCESLENQLKIANEMIELLRK